MLYSKDIYKSIIAVDPKLGWEVYEATMQVFLKYIQSAPSTLVAFAAMVMENCPKGGTFFDTALSFLPLDDWPKVVYHAIVKLRDDATNEAAKNILEYANLQHPAALQLYKEEIAKMIYPSGRLHFAAFDDHPSLYSPHAFHLVFPALYLAELLATRSSKEENHCHPTWIATPGEAVTFPFGGISRAICGICSGHLHHIITFDQVPDGFGVTSLHALELSVCLACLTLGSGVLSYQHDEQGCPHDISQGEHWPQFVEEKTSFYFKPTSAALVNLGSRWQRQDWGASNGRENLYRVGGHPSWIQQSAYTPCPLCNKISTFLMQLDEGLLTIDECTGEAWNWDWNGGGMGYILWCDSCKVSLFLRQST